MPPSPFNRPNTQFSGPPPGYEEDDGSVEIPPGLPMPPSPYSDLPPSVTQQHLEFLDSPDEVPEQLRERLWGLFTRHAELSNIFNETELTRARRRVRLICRPMMWANSSPGQEGDITFLDRMQIEHFVDLLLRKSYKQQERRLLAPWLQEQTLRAEGTESNRQRPQGMIGRGLNAIFGGRR